MDQLIVIKDVINRLNKLRIDYLITGSIASNYYGIPRLTHDVDIVVVLDKNFINELISTFEKEYYISSEGILHSLKYKTMFNLVHHKTGVKIDFWIQKKDEFNKSIFGRKLFMEIFKGTKAYIATPEDVILHKLLWNKESPSERQIGDASGVFAVQKEKLDNKYLKKWALKLDVEEELEKIITGEKLHKE